MEEELDTCSESAGCSAMGTGEGWDCSLLANIDLVQSETSRCCAFMHNTCTYRGLVFSCSYLASAQTNVSRDQIPPRKMPRHRRVSVPAQFRFLHQPPHFRPHKALYRPFHSFTTQSHIYTMVLGRLTHYAFDALAISVVLAGVKKQTGFGYVSFPSFYAIVSFASTFTPSSIHPDIDEGR